MNKTWICMVVIAMSLCALTLSGYGEEPKKPDDKAKTLMQRKLAHSQKVLEGIALKEFATISKHAEELIDISKQAEWRAIKTPQYEIHSNDFRRNAETLVKNAKEKNLDAAALTYVELTLNCVRCHKYVREVRWVRLDGEPAERTGATP